MDAVVHIFFEVSGTCGDLLSVKLIQVFGNNYSFFVTPPLFALAGLAWSFIDQLRHDKNKDATDAVDDGKPIEHTNYFHSILVGAKAFARSTYYGAVICFTHRRFIWLLPCYSLARTSRFHFLFILLHHHS